MTVLTDPFTLYDLLAWAHAPIPTWMRAALLVPAMFIWAMFTEVAQQWHYYAGANRHWSLWTPLESQGPGKHTLDFVQDPVPHAFAVVAGIDLLLYAGLAFMLTQLVQWYGVDEGTRRPEESTYDLGSWNIWKVHGDGRLFVFYFGAAVLILRVILLIFA